MKPDEDTNADGAAEKARIDEAAIGWLLERDEGMGAARRREFAAWAAQDARHAAAVRRLEKSLAVLEDLPAFREEVAAAFQGEPAAEAARPAGPGTARRWLALGGMAAALALGGWIWATRVSGVAEQRYATAGDARRTVALEDGTVMELNAATTARVRYARAERRVELEAGEAHFAVAPDARRPFTVAAGAVAVRAVGTVFNVRRDAAGVEVLVVEGKVRVEPAAAAATAAAAPLVQAGERVVVRHGAADARPEQADAAAIRAALRWQPNVAEFAEEPLREVVARFNRRNRLQLVVDDAELAACRIAGVFSLDEPEALVRLLERDGMLLGERRGPNEIRLRRKR